MTRVLILASVFAPSVGGIETATQSLAEALVGAGADVVVMTATPHEEAKGPAPFAVVRRPSIGNALRLHAGADIVVHQQPSLKWAPISLLFRKRLVVVVHIWLDQGRNITATLRRILKGHLLRRASVVVFVSGILKDSVRADGVVVHNSFDERVFCNTSSTRDSNRIVFVGRLIADKGASDAIRATAELMRSGLSPHLTVVGDGPEREALEKLAFDEGLGESVAFEGVRTGSELNKVLNECKVAVFPSRWREPFGIVALEAMAAGCRLVVTNNGGLLEASGGLALSAPPRNPKALSASIARALQGDGPDPNSIEVKSHLATHTRSAIGERLAREVLGDVSAHR